MAWDGQSNKNKRPGTIYLMYWPVNGEYKIGFTADLEKRKSQLGYTHRGIQLIHTFPADTMIYAESALKEHFNHKNVSPIGSGDWFIFDDSDVNSIKGITHYKDAKFYSCGS